MLLFFTVVNNFLLRKHLKRPGSLTTVSFRQWNGDIYSQDKYSSDIIINFIIHFIIFPNTSLLSNLLLIFMCSFFEASFNLYVTLIDINAPEKYLSCSLTLWFLEFAHLFLPCRVRGEEVTCTRHEGRGRKVFGFQLILHQLCKSDLSSAFDFFMIYVTTERIFQLTKLVFQNIRKWFHIIIHYTLF